MPKALSLKKVPKSPPKNQKSITSFFKNTSSSVQAEGSSKPTVTAKLSVKRKATSPASEGTSNINSNNSCQSTTNTPKKHRIKYEEVYSPAKKALHPKHVTVKAGTSSQSSYKNNLVQEESCSYESTKTSSRITKENKNNKERSPLATVNNIFENHGVNSILSDKLSINGREEKSRHNAKTPEKVTTSGNCKDKHNPYSRTPKKSPLQAFTCTPINKLLTPEKQEKSELSPSRSGSTVKVLDFDQNIPDAFGDDWDLNNMEEDGVENLDLSTMQRCEIVTIHHHASKLELKLKNDTGNKATCYIEGVWLYTPLEAGDLVSVLASRDISGHYSINNTSGLLVLRPDHLISSTSVVAGVFCKRKALLQERWRGIDSANTAMTTGILIHELVQNALTRKIMTAEELRTEADKIIKKSITMLFDAGLTEEETRLNMQAYIHPLEKFMINYIADKPSTAVAVSKDKNSWSGHVDKVLDIEENLCCPQLGLKGKIDATLQVTIPEKKGQQRAIVPLELKSGKASMSAEHRGQLVLYGMMLSLQRNEDPTQAVQRGLLLYLKDRVELREVSCGYPERRDLVMLRNQLVQHLATGPQDIDPEQLTDIEDASVLLQQRLPEPVDHENACTKCPYLTLCSLHLWHTDGPSVPESHPLSKLRDLALSHLREHHIKYFLHWTALLKMEERVHLSTSPLRALWTDTPEKRERKGTCAASVMLKSVVSSGDRFVHVFQRQKTDFGLEAKVTKGPQEGDFSIVSIDKRPWIAAGVVTVSNATELQILLERNLSSRLDKNVLYHIDTYESYATTVQNLTNLGVLMEDSERAERLRRLIIDKVVPQFESKLPREVGRLGTKLMRTLNIQQQRAVLKSLATKDYSLLQGLPGTGKTQTISVLIQMLVGLKQRVLVTAHTHSAVDTVLSRLPQTIKIMRLGSSARVASGLLNRTEQTVTADCSTAEELAKVYDSMEVVGVTCLGANHAMLSRTTFDVCIVDEATQVLQCTVLRPLFAAKRFVLVGDPEQLPPVVRSRAARRLGMEESLFHRLMREDATSTLQLQYRMNQTLADIANRVAYDSKLKCADQNVAQAKLNINLQNIGHLLKDPWLEKACSPHMEHAVLFLDVQFSSNQIGGNHMKSCTNHIEACIAIALVETLKQGDVKSLDIGVIAPYRDQVALLRRSLVSHSVEVSTVDQFQGRDKSVIIYSCTKWEEGTQDTKIKDGEVLNDPRRLAVSVTRAKHKLLVVGNSRALSRYRSIQRLIDACPSVSLNKNIVTDLYSKYKMLVS